MKRDMDGWLKRVGRPLTKEEKAQVEEFQRAVAARLPTRKELAQREELLNEVRRRVVM